MLEAVSLKASTRSLSGGRERGTAARGEIEDMRRVMRGDACNSARTTAVAITPAAMREPASGETREAARVAAFGASSLLLSLTERRVGK